MKIIHIISGVLLFLLIAVSSASAYELGTTATATSNPASIGKVQVTAVYGTNTITFSAKDLTGGSADIKKIGFNINPADIQSITITDNANPSQTWSPDLNGGQMDGLGDYKIVANNPDESKKPSVVAVTLTFKNSADTVTSLIQKNQHDPPFETAAHVSWTGGTAGMGGSAQVAGPSIPETPTIAAPVAVILGLLFITQRRKEN